MQKVTTPGEMLARGLGAAWLAVFLFLVVVFGSVRPPAPESFSALALAGMLYAAAFQRDALLALLRSQRVLIASAVATVGALLVAGLALSLVRPERPSMPLPPQIGLLLCIAPLAVLLADRRLRQLLIAVMAIVTSVHLVALPWEAVTGIPFFPGGQEPYPREMPPLRFQAHGLAWQVYYFPGLLMATFYLAAGGIGEERLFGAWRFSSRSWLVASLTWAAAIACLQSRSALAGALAVSLLGMLAFARVRRPRVWIALLVVAVVGAAVFLYLFSENKSGGSLRAAYVALYFRRGLDWEWLLTGRGYTVMPALDMQVPGLQYLLHSHNDFAQVLFTWGVLGLSAYLCLWAALVRLAWRSWREGMYWPALALLACAPSFLTDLGLHLMEKTAFLVVLAAMCASSWKTGARLDTGSSPV